MFSRQQISSVSLQKKLILSKTPEQHGMGPNKPFMNYDLELTEQERICLSKLKIQAVSHYENYGDLVIMPEELDLYFSALGEENAEFAPVLTKLVVRLVEQVNKFLGQETAWVTLRAFPPVSAFKFPRWHADRYDYPPAGEQYKAAITLKGASTLFYDAPLEDRKKLEPIKNNKIELDKIMDKSKLISAKPGQGTIFIVGSEYAPIHSEPDIKQDRLFVAIMPGSKQQILEVYRQTPEQEIMPLLLASGYYCYFVGPRLQSDFSVSPYEGTEFIVFKLSDRQDPHALESIVSVIKAGASRVKAEITKDDRPIAKFILPEGGVIIINDISWFLASRNAKELTDKEINRLLQEYALQCREPKREALSISPFSEKNASTMFISKKIYLDEAKKPLSASSTLRSREFIFNGIIGKNTSGLFRPNKKVDVAKHERSELTLRSML